MVLKFTKTLFRVHKFLPKTLLFEIEHEQNIKIWSLAYCINQRMVNQEKSTREIGGSHIKIEMHFVMSV